MPAPAGALPGRLRSPALSVASTTALELPIYGGDEPVRARAGTSRLKAAGNLRVEGRGDFRGQHVLHRLSLRDQLLHLSAHREDHVAIGDDVTALDDRAVARDKLGVRPGELHRRVEPVQHSLQRAWFIVVTLTDLACQYFGWPLPRVENFRDWVLRLFWIFDPSIRRRSVAIDF